MPSISLISTYQICAAHRLSRPEWTAEKNLAVFGKCAQTHGHQYTLQLHLSGEINADTGMLINEFDVEKIVNPFLTESFDHKFLNEDVAFFKDTLPTAEWISVWIYNELKNKFPQGVLLQKVVVHETPNLAVQYPG